MLKTQSYRALAASQARFLRRGTTIKKRVKVHIQVNAYLKPFVDGGSSMKSIAIRANGRLSWTTCPIRTDLFCGHMTYRIVRNFWYQPTYSAKSRFSSHRAFLWLADIQTLVDFQRICDFIDRTSLEIFFQLCLFFIVDRPFRPVSVDDGINYFGARSIFVMLLAD